MKVTVEPTASPQVELAAVSFSSYIALLNYLRAELVAASAVWPQLADYTIEVRPPSDSK